MKKWCKIVEIDDQQVLLTVESAEETECQMAATVDHGDHRATLAFGFDSEDKAASLMENITDEQIRQIINITKLES